MSLLPYPRVTPWVGRLIAANAVVLLLMQTLFTSPALQDALAFDPSAVVRQPWTFFTYLFVHGGLFHLLANSIGLFVFGSAVESRMGSRNFLTYYLYCGIGAAVFCWLLNLVMPVSPFIGASGAVLGVAIAFAMFWPDAEVFVFPIPIPLKARTLVILLVALDVAFALMPGRSEIAHLAHVGGATAGFLFFRLQNLSRRDPIGPSREVERVVMVQSGAPDEPERRASTPPRQRPRVEADNSGAELDRLLDKISATGIGSLTVSERRFLDEVSRKKKDPRPH
jgi:membrane associated rhomboid family serine protease